MPPTLSAPDNETCGNETKFAEKIRDALAKTDLKPEQLMMGYNGVKFDATGQNTLASTYLIQLRDKQYQLVWPEKAAATKLDWPMKGWKQ